MRLLTAISLAALSAYALSSCTTSTSLSASGERDDIYYSSADAKKDWAAEKARKEEERKQREADAAAQASDQSLKTVGQGESTDYKERDFSYDDYYDYEYAARLRRFHHPVGYYGYYDNYYTNSYWYNYNPYCWGTSIYMGYSWWGPTYYAYNYYPSTFWYWNSGWGWGCCNSYYNPWGYWNDPWCSYGWGYPYGGYPYGYSYGWGYPYYGYGYNNPYGYGGYGYNDNNYYNSYDNNSYYYGPRGTPGTGGGGRGNIMASQNGTFGERYVSSITAENGGTFPTRNEYDQILSAAVPSYNATPVNDSRSSHTSPIHTVDVGNSGTVGGSRPMNSGNGNGSGNSNNNGREQTQPVYHSSEPVYETPSSGRGNTETHSSGSERPRESSTTPRSETHSSGSERPRESSERPRESSSRPRYESSSSSSSSSGSWGGGSRSSGSSSGSSGSWGGGSRSSSSGSSSSGSSRSSSSSGGSRPRR